MHRYALLADNERTIAAKLVTLCDALPPLVASRIAAVMLIGSAAEGRARDASDLDVLCILREGLPTRAHYRWWDDAVEPALGDVARRPFPVQPVIVGRSALVTAEPHLRRAIATGMPLWDPERLFA